MTSSKSHRHHSCRPDHMILPNGAVAVGPCGRCCPERKVSEDSATLCTLTNNFQKSHAEKKQQEISSSSSCCRKTSIRFAEKCENKYYANTRICQDDLKSFWYTGKQIHTFRKKAKKVATAIVNLEKRCKKKKNGSSSSSYTGLLAKTFQNCRRCSSETDESVLSLSEQRKLTKRVRDSPKRLGLERMVIHMNRFETRRQMLEAVLSIQNETTPVLADKTNTTIDNNNDMPGEVTSSAEKIRQVCESLSRPYRLFARHLAQALVPKKSSIELTLD